MLDAGVNGEFAANRVVFLQNLRDFISASTTSESPRWTCVRKMGIVSDAPATRLAPLGGVTD